MVVFKQGFLSLIHPLLTDYPSSFLVLQQQELTTTFDYFLRNQKLYMRNISAKETDCLCDQAVRVVRKKEVFITEGGGG